MRRSFKWAAAATSIAVLAACGTMGGAKTGMSFFVTSAGPGKGADLGGLAGADITVGHFHRVIEATEKLLSSPAPIEPVWLNEKD